MRAAVASVVLVCAVSAQALVRGARGVGRRRDARACVVSRRRSSRVAFAPTAGVGSSTAALTRRLHPPDAAPGADAV
jgi:hypothetical protein